MKSQFRIFTFAVLKVVRDGDLKQAIPRTHNNLKPYRVQASRPVCLLLRFFYCATWKISTLHNSILHSDRDKGACNRYTSAFPVVGSGQSGRRRSGENSDSLFVRAFSLFFFSFLVAASVLSFLLFSFKLFTNENKQY